jgi:hypothetical protein
MRTSRFACKESEFADGIPSEALFWPVVVDGSYVLSVCNTQTLSEPETLAVGQRLEAYLNTFGRKTPRKLRGRADLEKGAFEAKGLKVISRPIANVPEHLDVIDWPATQSIRQQYSTIFFSLAIFTSY